MFPVLLVVLLESAAVTRTDRGASLDVVLYGAYGCVGHFAAHHLANQTGLRWAIAGRNATKLHALAAELTPLPSGTPEIIVASLSGDLASWVSRTRAVATAAGPFSIHDGENLIKACASLGVHYADTSDEFYWQRRMIERYDAAAAVSGARISLASGFCALAGDLGATLALELAHERDVCSSPSLAGEARVDAWLEEYSGGASAGVINTVHVNASYPKEWATDPYLLAPHAPESLKVDSLVDGMHYPGLVSGEGLIVPNLFGPYDARLMRRSFVGRNQTVHLRVGAQPAVYSHWLELILSHPASWPTLEKCPADVLIRDGKWQYKAVATIDQSACGRGVEPFARQTVATVELSGDGDPGYHFTAISLAEVALCLSGATQPAGAQCRGAGPGGVLSPALAVNASAMRARLLAIGAMRVAAEVSTSANEEEESPKKGEADAEQPRKKADPGDVRGAAAMQKSVLVARAAAGVAANTVGGAAVPLVDRLVALSWNK